MTATQSSRCCAGYEEESDPRCVGGVLHSMSRNRGDIFMCLMLAR